MRLLKPQSKNISLVCKMKPLSGDVRARLSCPVAGSREGCCGVACLCVRALPSTGDMNSPWTRGSSLGVTAECPPGSAASTWSGGIYNCARGTCDSMWELSWALTFPLPGVRNPEILRKRRCILLQSSPARPAPGPGGFKADAWLRSTETPQIRPMPRERGP